MWLVVILVVILTACSGGDSGIDPVESNADWTPVVQDFDGVEMVQVPPGCFTMGNDEGNRDERPAHEICFEDAYWIDRYEVTNAQYGSTGNEQGDNFPRENLTWVEARDHCLSRGARLPTEAEWEYAVRGPDNLAYPWGDELVEENLVFDRNSPGQTAEVGTRPEGVSWVGAYDLSGNVWEWTSSAYARYPYDSTDGRENTDDLSVDRVYRGGVNSYQDFAASGMARFHFAPEQRDWFIGFRCVRDSE